MSQALEELRRRFAEVGDLGRARALLAWDERTMMPPAGAAVRAEQIATLVRVRHERLASDEMGRTIDAAARECEGEPYDSDAASMVRVARRDWSKARRVPAELRAEIARVASLAETAWIDARRESDFRAFLPHLARNVELRRRYADCFEAEHPYDPLLDDFEPEMTSAEMRPLLVRLRDGLLPLIAAIAEREGAVDDSCLYGSFQIERQRELAREVVAELPLEPGAWRLDDTVHPFASAIAPSDIRLTTRYDERYIGTGLWSVIHEAGHGIYENALPPRFARTPLARPVSLGFHESQSRLWENWVGRGRPYLSRLLPRLRDAFPEQFADVDPEQLFRAANKIAPSLIRTEADEVTYNLHIVLRFELELAIFEDRLELSELPEAWNARTAELLAVEVPDDAHGVLQDVHWAAGSFGYFPTYALGNVIAAQLWDAVHADLPDLEERIGAGDLPALRERLAERLYRHGGKFSPAETIERAVGGTFDVRHYLDQLRAKLGEIYRLDSATTPA
jgi:carboxypeptidase Taq